RLFMRARLAFRLTSLAAGGVLTAPRAISSTNRPPAAGGKIGPRTGGAGLACRLTSLAAGVVLTALGACSSTTSLPPADGKLALGTWGSDSAGMIASDTSTHLHIKCTFGDMSGRVVLNSSGEFDVAGTYLLRAHLIAIAPPLPAAFR